MKEIIAAIQSIKILYEIVKANKGLTNYNELISTVAEVNTKLFDAQQMIFTVLQDRDTLANRVRELEKKIMETENRESELQKYESHTFPTGASALALKPEMQQTETLHYLCEDCARKGQIYRMKPDGFHNGNSFFLRCHICGLVIPTRESSPALDRVLKARMKV